MTPRPSRECLEETKAQVGIASQEDTSLSFGEWSTQLQEELSRITESVHSRSHSLAQLRLPPEEESPA